MQTQIANLTAELECLRSTIDELGAGITKLSLEGKVLWANRAYCNLLGYSAEEIIGLSIHEISVPEEITPQLKGIEEMLSGKRDSFSMDKRYRRKDGTHFWAQFVTKLQRDKDGKPTNFLTIIQDIQARKEAEIRLKESESRLAESQRIAHLGSWERDLRTNEVVFSDETYRIFGFEPGSRELTVERILGMIHPDDHEARVKFERTSGFENSLYQNSCRIIRHSDGSIRMLHAEATIQSTPDGVPCRMVGTVQDITEFKELESAREKTESLLNLVMNGMPALACYVDHDLRYLYCNQTYKKWFKLEPASLLGKTVAELVGPKAAEAIVPLMKLSLTGETVEWEGRVPYALNGDREIRSTYVPDRGPDGRVRGIVILVHDITSIKEGEKVIAQQRERLTQSARLAALGEMASGIAHEINNPLSIIFARSEILKDHATQRTLEPEKVASWADKLSDMALKISKIVKSIRAISRNGDEDPFALASVNSIFDDMTELCAGRFRRDQIRFQIELKNKNLSLECRKVQLEQVVLNLLNNSCDAVQHREDRWIKLEATDQGENIEISVTDSGLGISPELEQKIFLAFFTTKPVGQGTGLGLSLSRNIVSSHQGTLRLDRSTPHTRFVITLPKGQSNASDLASNSG